MRILISAILLINFWNALSQEVMIPYRQGELWGYADVDGTIIIQPQFEEAPLISKFNIYIVKKNNQYGLMKSDGTLIKDCVYDEIARYSTFDGFFLNQSEKFGYIDTLGQTIYQVKYDKNELFNLLLNPKSDGEIIMVEFDENSNSNAKNKNKNTLNYKSIERKGKYELVIESTQMIDNNIEISIDTTNLKLDSVIIINTYRSKSFALIQKNQKWGAFYGKHVVVPIKYNQIDYLLDSCDSLYFKVKKSNKWKLISPLLSDKQTKYYGDIMPKGSIDSTFTGCFYFNHGLVVVKNGKFGLVDFNGNKIIETDYDKITYGVHFTQLYYECIKDNKVGIVKKDFILPPIIDRAYKFRLVYQLPNFRVVEVFNQENKLLGYIGENGVVFYTD